MTREEELLLIRKVRSGDASAFEPLVREHQNHVYALAYRITGNEADAQDVAQDAFLRAYTSLKDFRGDSRFSVWLYRLTGNIAIDYLRKNKRLAAVPLYRTEDDGEEWALELPDDGPSPEELLARQETREEVRSAMASLPERDRQILALRELGGQTYEEIAVGLSLEVGTVKSRLNRARKKLCAALRGNGNFPAPGASNNGKGAKA